MMVQLSICRNQVRDEGNCGEVTNRGEEPSFDSMRGTVPTGIDRIGVKREASLGEARGVRMTLTNFVEPPGADPHARWCGEGGQKWPPLPDLFGVFRFASTVRIVVVSLDHRVAIRWRYKFDGVAIKVLDDRPPSPFGVSRLCYDFRINLAQ